MRIKQLFTVPEGERVTEKVFSRVLISSVCSILLCMTFLVSTTWAWFSVSIENTGNVIEISAVEPEVQVLRSGEIAVTPDDDGSYQLAPGEYSIQVKLKQPDQTGAEPGTLHDANHPVYVIMTVTSGDEIQYRVFAFDNRESDAVHTVGAVIGAESTDARIRFSVSWLPPANLQETTGEITV